MSLSQEYEQETLQIEQTITGPRHNDKTIQDNERDVDISHLCPIFQGRLPLCPFLGKTDHFVHRLVSDREQFNCSVSLASDKAI